MKFGDFMSVEVYVETVETEFVKSDLEFKVSMF